LLVVLHNLHITTDNSIKQMEYNKKIKQKIPDNQLTTNKKNTLLIILSLFIVAFSLRLIYFYSFKKIQKQIVVNNPIVDYGYYHNWAKNISNGDIIGKGHFILNPGWAYFLGIIYSFVGPIPDRAIIIQFILGSFICILIFLLGKILFNETVGIISAILFILYGYSYLMEGFLVSATFITICLLFFVLFSVKAQKTNLLCYWFLSGIFLGLAILGRGNNLLIAPIIIIWIIFSYKNNIIKSSLLFISGLTLIIAPVTIRNYIVTGEFVLTTVHGGLNFYKGNNPNSLGILYLDKFESPQPAQQSESFRIEASKRLNKELTLPQSSKYWFKEGFRFIINEPLKWIGLTFKKFVLFWNSQEIPININYELYHSKLLILKLLFLSFVIIGPLSLFGIFLCILEKDINKKFVGVIILVYSISIVLFFISGEYRYPIVPLLIIFSGFSVYKIYEFIKKLEIKKTIFSFLLLLILIFFVSYKFYKIEFVSSCENEIIDLYKNALNLLDNGKFEEANYLLKKVINVDPEFTEVRIVLARSFSNLKQYQQAIKELKYILRKDPKNKVALNDIGSCYYFLRDYKTALRYFKEALEIDPNYRSAKINYNTVYKLTFNFK